MPAKSATSRKWIAGALHAARAAAFLTIATGVNGTLSAVWPHYEPLYAYLVAVVVVAFLSSALLGITAAVAAVILYDWMYAPVRFTPSLNIFIPIGAAALIAIAARAILQLRNRPALAMPVAEPPLLPAIDRPEPVTQTVPPVTREVEFVVDERKLNELTERLKLTQSAARAREAELQSEIEALRARAEDQGNRSVSARREYDEMRARVEQAENRAAALQQGLEAAQRRADEAQTRVARETALREQLEVAGHESLQRAVADLNSKHEAAQLELKQRLEVATKRLESSQKELKEERARAEREAAIRAHAETSGNEKLQKSLADLQAKHETFIAESRKHVDGSTAKINALQRELDRTLVSLSDEHNRADREARLRAQLEAAARETLHRTADVSASHRREAEESREVAAAAEARAQAAADELQVANARASAADERAHAAEERAIALEQQVEQLRSELSELSGGHDQQSVAATEAAERATAAEERANAAEARATTSDQRIAALQMELDSTRREFDALMLRDELEGAAHAKVAADLDAVRKESESLRAELQKARAEAAHEKSQRETAAAEYDERLRRIIDGINTDYEAAIGEALLEKEAAKAELRAIGVKLQKLAETPRGDVEGARKEIESLRADLEIAREHALQEKAKRDAAAADYDERMRRIVDNINADYEAAVGEALIEKESAKAELRAANQKIQQADSLRAELNQAREELASMRAAAESERDLLTKAFDEKLQRIVSGITADHENAIGDSLIEREAAKAEMRTMTKKIEILQQKLDEEKKLRDRLDAEWGEKLQKIVNHLTEDHEVDLGEAIVQKEAARAEARTLQGRVTVLQQRLEEEREKFRQAAERWQQDRGSAARRPITPTIEQAIPAVPAQSDGKTHVVLIVHSDASIRAVAKHTLQQSGYTVITAADGLEGLRMATQQRPHVVIAEAVMPKMNARELVQLLKSRPETADVKVILISATAEPERAADFRADDIVRNPADTNDLRAAISNVLSRVM